MSVRDEHGDRGVDLARAAVERALAAGADAADVIVGRGRFTSVTLRDGDVQNVEQSNSSGLGVRALVGGRTGLSFTNDLSADEIGDVAARAVELARISGADEHAGLPEPGEVGAFDGELDLVDPGHADWNADTWAGLARAAEEAARSVDGVTHTDAAGAHGGVSRTAIASSSGFAAERVRTTAGMHVGIYATSPDGERHRGEDMTSATHLRDLAEPSFTGGRAARRAVEACGFRRPPSGKVPVVFSPTVARELAQSIAAAASAETVYGGRTFLAGRLGEMVAAPHVHLTDDATLPRRTGSRPFDAEGVRSRRTAVIDGGRLASWIADTHSGRRIGRPTTGNASRGVGSVPHVSTSNLVLHPGELEPSELLRRAGRGLYVEHLFGFGTNLASGSFSRGGSGFWIEDGERAYPVQEFTVAGDLREMLTGVVALGNDLEWMGSCAAPTVLMPPMTVASG